jgi:prefoldin subunit 5
MDIENLSAKFDTINSSLNELRTGRALLEQKIGSLEKYSASKSDIDLLAKDIKTIKADLGDVSESLKGLSDFPTIKKIIYSGVGFILLAILGLAGRAIVNFIGS